MKKQANKKRRETKEWKRGDKVLLSTKDLMFKERLVKKLVDQYVGPYIIDDEVVFTDTVVTNFIQLISLQLVDQFSQTKLHWKAPNKSYLHICGMYKSDNRLLRY